MKIVKPGGHRLFERDPETAEIVTRMLVDLEKNGMDAVRKYSAQFDGWDPTSFQLSAGEIENPVVTSSPVAAFTRGGPPRKIVPRPFTITASSLMAGT